MEILSSARRHGVADDSIRHAVAHAIGGVAVDDPPGFVMWVGPDLSGNLIEVGVIAHEGTDVVIHAMPARERYLKFIEGIL